MKCDRCAAWTEVAETRQVDSGHTLKRTRRCGNGHRFVTYEFIGSLYTGDRRRVQQALRAIKERVACWTRYVALARLAREWGVEHAARLGNTSRASVQRAIKVTQPKTTDKVVLGSMDTDSSASG